MMLEYLEALLGRLWIRDSGVVLLMKGIPKALLYSCLFRDEGASLLRVAAQPFGVFRSLYTRGLLPLLLPLHCRTDRAIALMVRGAFAMSRIAAAILSVSMRLY